MATMPGITGRNVFHSGAMTADYDQVEKLADRSYYRKADKSFGSPH
ncbi:MAG: hypothetical protein ACLRIP_12075 [Blautia massiliensis (ex Durand et al. 2017)]